MARAALVDVKKIVREHSPALDPGSLENNTADSSTTTKCVVINSSTDDTDEIGMPPGQGLGIKRKGNRTKAISKPQIKRTKKSLDAVILNSHPIEISSTDELNGKRSPARLNNKKIKAKVNKRKNRAPNLTVKDKGDDHIHEVLPSTETYNSKIENVKPNSASKNRRNKQTGQRTPTRASPRKCAQTQHGLVQPIDAGPSRKKTKKSEDNNTSVTESSPSGDQRVPDIKKRKTQQRKRCVPENVSEVKTPCVTESVVNSSSCDEAVGNGKKRGRPKKAESQKVTTDVKADMPVEEKNIKNNLIDKISLKKPEKRKSMGKRIKKKSEESMETLPVPVKANKTNIVGKLKQCCMKSPSAASITSVTASQSKEPINKSKCSTRNGSVSSSSAGTLHTEQLENDLLSISTSHSWANISTTTNSSVVPINGKIPTICLERIDENLSSSSQSYSNSSGSSSSEFTSIIDRPDDFSDIVYNNSLNLSTSSVATSYYESYLVLQSRRLLMLSKKLHRKLDPDEKKVPTEVANRLCTDLKIEVSSGKRCIDLNHNKSVNSKIINQETYVKPSPLSPNAINTESVDHCVLQNSNINFEWGNTALDPICRNGTDDYVFKSPAPLSQSDKSSASKSSRDNMPPYYHKLNDSIQQTSSSSERSTKTLPLYCTANNSNVTSCDNTEKRSSNHDESQDDVLSLINNEQFSDSDEDDDVKSKRRARQKFICEKKIADSTSTNKIADSTSTNKIADSTSTNKIADSTSTNTTIADLTSTNNKIADMTSTSNKIADFTSTNNKIADSTNNKFVDSISRNNSIDKQNCLIPLQTNVQPRDHIPTSAPLAVPMLSSTQGSNKPEGYSIFMIGRSDKLSPYVKKICKFHLKGNTCFHKQNCGFIHLPNNEHIEMAKETINRTHTCQLLQDYIFIRELMFGTPLFLTYAELFMHRCIAKTQVRSLIEMIMDVYRNGGGSHLLEIGLAGLNRSNMSVNHSDNAGRCDDMFMYQMPDGKRFIHVLLLVSARSQFTHSLITQTLLSTAKKYNEVIDLSTAVLLLGKMIDLLDANYLENAYNLVVNNTSKEIFGEVILLQKFIGKMEQCCKLYAQLERCIKDIKSKMQLYKTDPSKLDIRQDEQNVCLPEKKVVRPTGAPSDKSKADQRYRMSPDTTHFSDMRPMQFQPNHSIASPMMRPRFALRPNWSDRGRGRGAQRARGAPRHPMHPPCQRMWPPGMPRMNPQIYFQPRF